MFKATETSEKGEYKVHATAIWKIFSRKESTDRDIKGRLSVILFRELAKACPPVLGKFDEDSDSLLFKMPSDETEGWKLGLSLYANVTEAELRAAFAHQDKRGGPRKKRQA